MGSVPSASPAATLVRSLHSSKQRSVFSWRYTRLPPRAVLYTQAINTPQGLARAHVDVAASPVAALVLGHGAGGGVESPDLVGAANAARSAGLSVALVE